ncbi:MAG: hypothetical protein ACKOWO_01275 [Sediminibacterium sp.]
METSIESLAVDYLSEFHLDGQDLVTSPTNYDIANRSDKVFDDAYDKYILPFLLLLGKKIIKGAKIILDELASDGITLVGNEMPMVEKMIGFVDGKVIKGGYLHTLGKMGVLRQKFHDYTIKAVSSGQKMNRFMRDMKPIFKSTDKVRSSFSTYYLRYAYDSVAQAMNSISLYVADKNGLNKFIYEGGLVKDSREFCKQHAGGIYTREDAKRFDEMTWRGKIPNVPFLIACGGYNCQHSIRWLPK